MKNRFRIVIRRKSKGGKVWWIHDSQTNDQSGLGTCDEKVAWRILDSRNNSNKFAGFHYLLAQDPDAFSALPPGWAYV